ncbi:MAG TPA: hypothetical protein DDW67_00925 [Elusimicrobia bacterium]|jgi:hypothetical protein|nr:hypothetical protein [Elusimicrobiota bacterium]
MATIFSDTLTKLRREAGFPTAYRFFHDNGGDKVLGMCYRKYLMMEQGRILPQFKHLRGFIFGMHLVRRSAASRELVRAWLRTMAGEELYGEILEPMLAESPEKLRLSPSQKMLKEALAGRKFYMTPAHLALVSASGENYLAFLLFSNDSGSWTPERLAEAGGFKKAAAAAIIKRFLAAKLLRKAGAGYKCPLAGGLLEMPPKIAAPAAYEALKRRQEELILTGQRAYLRRGLFRADADAIRDFYPMMSVNVSSSHVYAVKERTAKSALFAVEGRVVKIRDF